MNSIRNDGSTPYWNLLAETSTETETDENKSRDSTNSGQTRTIEIPDGNSSISVTLGNQSFVFQQHQLEESRQLTDFITVQNGIGIINLDEFIGADVCNEEIGAEKSEPLTENELVSILKFLGQGTIEITKENVFHLINVAKYLRIESLKEECSNFLFLTKAISPDNFYQVWKICTGFPSAPQLFPVCIEFFRTSSEFSSDNEINNAFKKIKDAVPEEVIFEDSSIRFSNPWNHYDKKALDSITDSLKKMEQTIRELFPHVGIPALAINSVRLQRTTRDNYPLLLEFLRSNPQIREIDLGEAPDISEEQLNDLARSVKELYSFSIKSSNIKNIPNEIEKHVQVLKCISCHRLEKLEASEALKVHCWNCNFFSIYLPKAKTVDFLECRNFLELNLPEALKVDCRCCNFTKFKLPKAHDIKLSGCKNFRIDPFLLSSSISKKQRK